MNRRHILVIEDDAGIQAVTKFSLEMDAHWQVTTAYSGREGLSKAISLQPDVILLDLILLDISGVKVLKKLQQEQATKNIPVILFTAKPIEAEILKLEHVNVVGLITKPFNCLDLSARVSEILEPQSKLAIDYLSAKD